MSGVNKVILIGRLGQDPEVRYTASGAAIANLSVATSEKWKDKQTGEQKEATEWHRVVMFGKLAEIGGQYLKKGSNVYLEGKLKTNKWQDQSGADRYTTEVVLDFGGVMQMLDSKQGNQQQTRAAPQQQYQQQPQQPQQNYQQPMNNPQPGAQPYGAPQQPQNMPNQGVDNSGIPF